jgi:hypothetical protein
MATLEAQYNRFLKDNPGTTFSFNEWMGWHRNQIEQALIQMMQDDEELGLYDDIEINRIELICKDCNKSLEDCTCIQDTIDMKQETTLEEAAEKYIETSHYMNLQPIDFIKFGAKWQQERSYSEEEVIAFGEFIFKHTLLAHSKGVKNLFEKFKKK